MRKYVTEEKINKVNPENLLLGDDFIDYLRSVDRADSTIRQYTNDLKILWVLILDNCKNKYFIDIDKRDIIRLQSKMVSELGWSSARIRRFKSTASSLSNYIENILDDIYPEFRNIMNKIENPVNEPVRKTKPFTFDKAKEVADKLIEDGKIKAAFYLILAVASGARKSEILRFKVSDLDENKIILGSLYETDEIKTKGRGDNLMKKYIIKSLIDEYIPIYMKHRDSIGVETEYLIYKSGDGKAKVGTANSLTTTIKKYFGEDRFYSHLCRHSYATQLNKLGLPVDVVQKIVGHKSINMTSHYIHRKKEDLLSEYFKDGEIINKKATQLKDI